MRSTINRQRILVVIASATLLVAGILIAPIAVHSIQKDREARAEQPHAIVATDSEQTHILDAVLRNKSLDSPHPYKVSALRPVVLISTSAVFCTRRETENPANNDCDALTADHFDDLHYHVDIPKKLIAELVLGNKSRSAVPFPSKPGVIVAEREVVDRLFATLESGWNGFYSQFPNSSGFIEVSRAVLTPDRTSALIYVSHSCGGLCGTGTLYLLRLENRIWRISSEAGIWVS